MNIKDEAWNNLSNAKDALRAENDWSIRNHGEKRMDLIERIMQVEWAEGYYKGVHDALLEKLSEEYERLRKDKIVMKVMLDEGAYMPEKAHISDAGYDIRTPINVCVPAGGYASVDTGVHVEIPEGYVGLILTKSGINMNRNCATDGVIDSGYTGSIRVKIYNFGPNNEIFREGDKITQLVLMPIMTGENLEQVDSLEETERGDNGFGSTGR